MARNPYQLDPYFAQGLSNLTNALIGNPETDYQVSRTKYTDAQTNRLNELLPYEKDQFTADIGRLNSIAGAEDARGKKLTAETTGIEALNNAATTLSNDPVFQGAAAAVLGLEEGQTLTPDALQALALTAIAGGNPDQRSSALSNIGSSGQDIRAGEMILSGTDDDAQRGALFKSPGGGKFQNPAFAGIELDKTLDNLLEQKQIEGDTDEAVARINKASAIDVANIQATSAEKIASEKVKYQQGWEEYKADKAAEADIEVANIQDEAAKRRLTAEIEWEKENDIVIDDNIMVFSPEAAERYGITSEIDLGDGKKVLAIDTSQFDPNGKEKIEVKINDTDSIFVSEENINKIPVERVNGVLTWIEGASTQTSSGSGNPTSRTNMVMQNLTEENVSDLSSTIKDRMVALEGLSPNVMMGVSDQIIKDIDAAIGKAKAKGEELLVQEAYNQIASPVINKGVIELGRMNPAVSNIIVPQFYHERWLRMGQEVGTTRKGELFTEENYRNAIRKNAKALGYNDKQIKQILESY